MLSTPSLLSWLGLLLLSSFKSFPCVLGGIISHLKVKKYFLPIHFLSFIYLCICSNVTHRPDISNMHYMQPFLSFLLEHLFALSLKTQTQRHLDLECSSRAIRSLHFISKSIIYFQLICEKFLLVFIYLHWYQHHLFKKKLSVQLPLRFKYVKGTV